MAWATAWLRVFWGEWAAWWSTPPPKKVNVTPDGMRYMSVFKYPQARPYYLRWLLPYILRDWTRRWSWCTRISIVALAPLAWWYTGSPWMMACVFLGAVFYMWQHPVLVDPTAQALGLLAACLWHVSPPAAIAVVMVAACVRETTPVFAAAWVWTPWMLLGLIPVGIRYLTATEGEDPEFSEYLLHPIRAGLNSHREGWLSPGWLVYPWSGLVLGLAVLDPWTAQSAQLAAGLVLGYGQLLLAVDTLRLYQWAWPSLALACTQALPPQWLPLIAVSLVFNPWRG